MLKMKLVLKTLIIITAFSIYFFLNSPTYAEENQSEIDQILTDIEDERIEKLETSLGLTIPSITDNPNHIVSFKDPSGDGVKLEIDGQGYKKVDAPYTLPSLGIGRHTLSFKFIDTEETSQTLEKVLIVIPRPPIINAPEKITSTEVTLSGTALAGSYVEIFIANGTVVSKSKIDVNTEGIWNTTIKKDFAYGIYNTIAITKKNGYASEFSEVLTFEISRNNISNTTETTLKPIHFSFKDINKNSISDIVANNTDLVYLVVICIFLGISISIIFDLIKQTYLSKKREGSLKKIINTESKKADRKEKNDKKDNTSMTLREKFERASSPKNDIKPENGEKTISKAEFLEKFKDKDPDSRDGVEKKKTDKTKPRKKSSLLENLKISLTSDKP